MQPRRPVKERRINDYIFPILSLSLIVGGAFFLGKETSLAEPVADMPSATMARNGSVSEPQVQYEMKLLEGTSLEQPQTIQFSATEQTNDSQWEPLSVYRWLGLMSHPNASYAAELAEGLIDTLANVHMNAFFFETKGVSQDNASRKQFEFVLLQSQYLFDFADARQDAVTFAEHLRCAPPDAAGCVFSNLGGDSVLVAPTQIASGQNVYGHLAAFSRRAPRNQQTKVWRLVAETFLKQLQDNKEQSTWFSTDGTGVRWLHFRFDPRPKYYSYRPFANEK